MKRWKAIKLDAKSKVDDINFRLGLDDDETDVVLASPPLYFVAPFGEDDTALPFGSVLTDARFNELWGPTNKTLQNGFFEVIMKPAN